MLTDTQEKDRQTFIAAGRAMYGEEYAGPLSDRLGINYRSICRFISGSKPVPPGVLADVSKALQQHIDNAKGILRRHATVADIIARSGA